MKTLVIHPKDSSTDFLKPIYEDIEATVVTKHLGTNRTRKLIKEHDRIFMLGHGTEEGLISELGLAAIDSSLVQILREKELVGIWCNADVFFKKYKLKGFYTGMIVSEWLEALMYNIHQITYKDVDESNKLFTESVKKHINSEYMVEDIQNYYQSKNTNDNPIIEFNSKNLYYD